MGRPALRSEGGQAAVELVAALPFVVLLAAVLWQAALAGQAAWLAGSAARAAARAEAVGGDPASAARGVLPTRLERGLRVRRRADGAAAPGARPGSRRSRWSLCSRRWRSRR